MMLIEVAYNTFTTFDKSNKDNYPMLSRNITFFFLFAVFCSAAAAETSLLKQIEQRAAEIEKFLPDKPTGIGRTATDRTAWETLAKENPDSVKTFITEAEKLAAQPIPVLAEELYKEYYKNGNRRNYQSASGQKYRRLPVFVFAECFENKGRFIKPLEEFIVSACADKSWLLPAHDSNGLVYDGKDNYIDLVSSDVSAELALADYFLQDKLSPEIRRLIRDNVQRRTFDSYETTAKEHLSGKRKKNWWISGGNNWNSVCHANVVCAAVTFIESKEKRAWYIACAEHFMTPFFKGFPADGYCTEGMGYWNYGFGHFTELAEIVHQTTGGKVDFFTMPLVKNCAMFGLRMEVAPNMFAAFADCSITARPDASLVKFLNKRLQLGYEHYENVPYKIGNLKATAVYCFPNSADKMPKGETAASPVLEARTLFPEGGVFIGRNPCASLPLGFACKAGHNAESHNHNDIGSFTVFYAGRMPVLDPGGEIYTRRTFSSQRYDSKLLNSYGHPVPVINGQLQKTGRQYCGKEISKEFSETRDVWKIDIAPAYGLNELKQLDRTFEYVRRLNQLTVTDDITFSQTGTVEEALLTYQDWRKKDGTDDTVELVIGGKSAVINIRPILVSVKAESGGRGLPLEFKSETIDEDAAAGQKPVRFGFAVKEPADNVKFVIVVKPEE